MASFFHHFRHVDFSEAPFEMTALSMMRISRLVLKGVWGSWGLFLLLLCATPPVSRDALIHHLAIPKLYLNAGGMYEIPGMPYAYYPGNIDLLYLLPLYFNNDILAKYIHFSFGLITAMLMYRYLKRRSGPHAGLLGGILFLSIPLISKLAVTVYVDLGLTCFTCAAMLGLFEWAENGCCFSKLMGPGIACGLSMGTKYNGLICCALLTLMVGYLYQNNEGGGGIRHAFASMGRMICFCMIACTVFSPWMIRNTLWTGNPVFPLYNSLFNPPSSNRPASVSVEQITNYRITPINFRRDIYNESGWQIAAVPIRIFFQGEDGNMRLFDGRLTPLLLLSVFAFVRTRSRRESREKLAMAFFSVLSILVTLFQSVFRVRYMVYALPMMTILSIYGVRNLWSFEISSICRVRKNAGKLICLFCLSVGALWSLSYGMQLYMYVKPFDYLSGTVDRNTYIGRYRFEHPAFQYINEQLPASVLLYNIYLGKRGYYLDRKYIPDVNGHTDEIRRIIEKTHSSEGLLRVFNQRGVTHWVVNEHLFMKRVKESYSSEQLQVLRNFFSHHLVRVYQDQKVGVYELVS